MIRRTTGYHCVLHSIPTRRSSDLVEEAEAGAEPVVVVRDLERGHAGADLHKVSPAQLRIGTGQRVDRVVADDDRSEEHTSELQSHSDLVCRLLLEKK